MSNNNLHPIFREVLAPFEPRNDGDLINELNAVVDNAIDLGRARQRENKGICYWCRKTLGEHSHEGHRCPEIVGPLFSTRHVFRPLICGAVLAKGSWDPGQQCGRSVVPGTEYCAAHQERMRSQG